MGVLFVDHYDAGRDTGAIEKVGGQADNALDESALDDRPARTGQRCPRLSFLASSLLTRAFGAVLFGRGLVLFGGR